MKTPLKPGLDDEIYEVEARISHRRTVLPRVARDTGRSALHALASPYGLAAAAAVGFLAGGGLRRNGAQRPRYNRRKESKDASGKGIAIGSLLMSGAVALIRAQFGSPLEMAQFVVSKIQARKTQPAAPAQSRRRP